MHKERTNLNQEIKILLIEDDDEHAEIISGFTIRAFPSSQIVRKPTLGDGIAFANDNNPDILLLDLDLPDSKADQTLQNIASFCDTLPVIVLSSFRDESTASNAVVMGVQDYLLKEELNAEIVYRSIRHSIERKQLELNLKKSAEELSRKNNNLERIIALRTEDLARSERQYRSLIHLAPLGILKISQDGKITFSNPEFKRIFNNNIYLQDFITDSYRNEFLGKLDESYAKKDGPSRFYANLRDKTGNERCCEIIFHAIWDQDDTFDHFICIIDDVTEKMAQEKLEREKRIAEAANQAKSLFLANIGHEIRTPLAAITGFVDLALEGGPVKKVNEYLQVIRRNSKHLLALIDDMLDLSKIEMGQVDIRMESFLLQEEIENVLSSVRHLAENKGIELQVRYQSSIPETVKSDPRKLRQILINLINNAIKHTDVGGVFIDVNVDVVTEGAGILSIVVADTGKGIDLGVQKNLFKPFCHGDYREKSSKDGMGIGLALSRNLARKLGGDLILLSTGETGSKFQVMIEIKDLGEVRMLSPTEIVSYETSDDNRFQVFEAVLKGRSVLIAEDDPDLQFLLSSYLVRLGAEVDVVRDGREAVNHVMANPYDIVFMDIQMPIMDGVEATKNLRSVGYRGKVIALTAHALEQERQSCMAAGFDNFLSKPIDVNRIVSLLEDIGSIGITPELDHTQFFEDLKQDPMMVEAFKLFHKNLKDKVGELATSIEISDWNHIEQIAHQIKGSSACYGFLDISQLAYEIEKEAHQKEKAKTMELVKRLREKAAEGSS
jgi:PAS domain S-box-containing protein